MAVDPGHVGSTGNMGSTQQPSFRELVRQATVAGNSPRPVAQWHPPLLGELEMRIARDGRWYYGGSLIQRPAMVQLFASILRREEDGTYNLVTPVERWRLEVEDVPFVAVDFDVMSAVEGPCLVFTTNVGDRIVAGPNHPLRFARSETVPGQVIPYVRVRGGLDARVDRKCLFRMVDLAEIETVRGEEWLGVRSGGQFFEMMRQSACGT